MRESARRIGFEAVPKEISPELATRYETFAEFRELSGGTAVDVSRAMRKEHHLKALAQELSSNESEADAYYTSGDLEIDTRKARAFMAEQIIRELLISEHSIGERVLSPLHFLFHLPWEGNSRNLSEEDANVIITVDALKEVMESGLFLRLSWTSTSKDTVRGFQVPGDEKMYTVSELLDPKGPLQGVFQSKENANHEMDGYFNRGEEDDRTLLANFNYGAKLEALLRDSQEIREIAESSLSGGPGIFSRVGAEEAAPSFLAAYKRAKEELTLKDKILRKQLARAYCRELRDQTTDYNGQDLVTFAITTAQATLNARTARQERLIEMRVGEDDINKGQELIKDANYLVKILKAFETDLREEFPSFDE